MAEKEKKKTTPRMSRSYRNTPEESVSLLQNILKQRYPWWNQPIIPTQAYPDYPSLNDLTEMVDAGLMGQYKVSRDYVLANKDLFTEEEIERVLKNPGILNARDTGNVAPLHGYYRNKEKFDEYIESAKKHPSYDPNRTYETILDSILTEGIEGHTPYMDIMTAEDWDDYQTSKFGGGVRGVTLHGRGDPSKLTNQQRVMANVFSTDYEMKTGETVDSNEIMELMAGYYQAVPDTIRAPDLDTTIEEITHILQKYGEQSRGGGKFNLPSPLNIDLYEGDYVTGSYPRGGTDREGTPYTDEFLYRFGQGPISVFDASEMEAHGGGTEQSPKSIKSELAKLFSIATNVLPYFKSDMHSPAISGSYDEQYVEGQKGIPGYPLEALESQYPSYIPPSWPVTASGGGLHPGTFSKMATKLAEGGDYYPKSYYMQPLYGDKFKSGTYEDVDFFPPIGEQYLHPRVPYSREFFEQNILKK